jgi:hypothetical protein
MIVRLIAEAVDLLLQLFHRKPPEPPRRVRTV